MTAFNNNVLNLIRIYIQETGMEPNVLIIDMVSYLEIQRSLAEYDDYNYILSHKQKDAGSTDKYAGLNICIATGSNPELKVGNVK